MPFDFMFENEVGLADEISEELDSNGISYQREAVETFIVPAEFAEEAKQILQQAVDECESSET